MESTRGKLKERRRNTIWSDNERQGTTLCENKRDEVGLPWVAHSFDKRLKMDDETIATVEEKRTSPRREFS